MKTTRIFTPTRIVALVVIGVLVLGLAYLRFAPGRLRCRFRPAPRPAT
jgi:hypothetical protein